MGCVELKREGVCDLMMSRIIKAIASILLCILSSVGCSQSEKPPISGQAASWQALLSRAQQAADEISKGAVLMEVYANPAQLQANALRDMDALRFASTLQLSLARGRKLQSTMLIPLLLLEYARILS